MTITKKCTLQGMSMLGNAVDTSIIDGCGVSNTTILRLKYETNELIKNAYAVDVPTDVLQEILQLLI